MQVEICPTTHTFRPFSWKERVSQSFSKAARHYDQKAYIQQMVASYLFRGIQQHVRSASSILELGSGTGFLTKKLLHHFPTALLEAVDISPVMHHKLRERLSHEEKAHLMTYVEDMDQFEGSMYSLIASSCSLQWSSDPLLLLQKNLHMLAKKGFLAHALPLKGSFQSLCDRGYFSPERLYSLEELLSVLKGCDIVLVESIPFRQMFPSPLAALKAIRSFGGGVSSLPQRSLFSVRGDQNPISCEWNIGCIIAKRRT